MKNIEYAVLGAGNGGQCVSAYLTLMGYKVSLFDRYENIIKPIKEKGGIELKGVSLNGFAQIDTITTDIKEAVSDKKVILVIVPAFAHEYLARILAPVLEDGQVIVLCPGSTGGVLEFKKILEEENCKASIKLAETYTLFYACRCESPGVANIFGIKSEMPIASMPSDDVDYIINLLKDPYPELIKAQNVLETGLANLNAVMHPIPVLLNTGWIEATKGNFRFYYDGYTPHIVKMIEKIDKERIEICNALGIETKDVKDDTRAIYPTTGETLEEVIKSVEAYKSVNAPPCLETRLLLEDIPMGLVPMAEIAKIVGVKTPIMDMIINLASEMLDIDFRKEGRNQNKLGIENMNKDDILNYVR